MSRGQIAERMTVVRSGSAEAPVELEALWQPGVAGGKGLAAGEAAMPVIIAGPHPRLGGNMDAPACAEIVWHLARRAHPTIRFNWRGTGASTGVTRLSFAPFAPDDAFASDDAREAALATTSAAHEVHADIDDEVHDLERVVDHHAAGAPCAIVGVSFGCAPAVIVAARHPLVERVVLVAPPVASGMPLDLQALLASGVPVGVVAAAEDKTAPLAAIEAALAKRVRLEVVAGAGHTFTAGLVELGRRVAAFLPGAE